MASFDMRNNAEFGLALSATLSGTTASAGNWAVAATSGPTMRRDSPGPERCPTVPTTS